MAKKSIGDLHATITANAVQFVDEFKRADTASKQAAGSIKKTLGQQLGNEMGKAGKKFAMGFIGAAAIGTIIKELKDVAANIQSIPGISSGTIASVQTMNYELFKMKQVGTQSAAWVLGAFSDLGNGIGFALGQLVYGEAAAAQAMAEMNREAEAFANIEFDKKLAGVLESIRAISANKGQTVDYLREETKALRDLAEGAAVASSVLAKHPLVQNIATETKLTGGMTASRSKEVRLLAAETEAKATSQWADLLRTNTDLFIEYTRKVSDSQNIHAGVSKQLEFWQEQYKKALELRQKGVALENSTGGGAAGIEMQNRALEQMTFSLGKINELQKKTKLASVEMMNSFADAFSTISDDLAEFVITGEFKLSNFTDTIAKSVISTLLKLAIVNPILNGMFGGASGWAALPQLIGGHANGGPMPAFGFSRVNERGPELLSVGGEDYLMMGSQSGMITPNEKLGSVSSGGGNLTIQIDATGADAAGLRRVEAAIQDLNRNFDMRAMSAVSNGKQRGYKV